MKFERFEIAAKDVDHLQAFVASRRDDSYVRDRLAKNVEGPPPSFDREQFWRILLGCLLTSQQRSTAGAPVDRFLELEPFPLTLALCGRDVEQIVGSTLKAFGGIRMHPTIARRAHANHTWLAQGGWAAIQSQFESLAKQRSRQAEAADKAMERNAARLADQLAGIGPKQSRNLWQWLGLTRFEIPLDSRVCTWVNQHLSISVEIGKLVDDRYYEMVLDHVQALCHEAGVLPSIFDAAAFDYGEEKKPESKGQAMSKGTTIPGYKNANGQITIRNTGIPGTDHLQSVYHIVCSGCGNNYGVNGSDIHDRKCPKCQGGMPGLPLVAAQA